MSERSSSHYWMLWGPLSLILAVGLLILKMSPHFSSPIWIVGLCASILIACWMIFLTFREILLRENRLYKLDVQRAKEASSLRSVFDEANALYREKVAKLESTARILEEELAEAKLAYQTLTQAHQREKAKSSSLLGSLEDALDALREIRQSVFIKESLGRAFPPDLPKRYRQLKEQFDEKALILDQTRRRLFRTEGQLFTAQKVCEDTMLEDSEGVHLLCLDLLGLDRENQNLEWENSMLESLISALVSPAKSNKSANASSPDSKRMLQLDFHP